MHSQLYNRVYHLENNLYCNDDLLICRLFKLVIVFFKTRNVFTFYLLKMTKECNVSAAIMTLLNSDNPKLILTKLIGSDPPDHLACSVGEYEIQLIPQYSGNYDVLITYENRESLAVESDNKTCIVCLNDYLDINPVQLFRLISSSHSPNTFATTDMVTSLQNAYEEIPSHQILLLSSKSLEKNVKHLARNKQDMTIHVIRKDMFFKPVYPAMNFAVGYLEEDKHLAEPLLPTFHSCKPYFVINKLASLESYFS